MRSRAKSTGAEVGKGGNGLMSGGQKNPGPRVALRSGSPREANMAVGL